MEYLTYQDKLYQLYRRVRVNDIKEGKIENVKEGWLCDIVLKNKSANDDILLFLREIKEAEIES